MLLVLLCLIPSHAQANPQPVATAGDGSYLLWNNSDGNGAVDLWASSGLPANFTTHYTYGPYPGWSAKALGTGHDGIPRILWSKTDGSAALWRIDGSGGFTQTTYGPYPGWIVRGMAVGYDNVPHILWVKNDGTMSLWAVAADGSFTQATYGPYSGFRAFQVAIGTDNVPRILWIKTDGSISVWYGLSGTAGYSHTEYGPFPGYTPLSMAGSGNNTVRLLWDHPADNTVSQWNLASNGTYTYQKYTNPVGSYPVGTWSDSSSYTQILYDQPDGTAIINFLNADGGGAGTYTVPPPGTSTGGGGGGTGNGGTGTATPNPHGSYSVVYSYAPGSSSSTDGAAGVGAATTSYDTSYGDTVEAADAHFSGNQYGNAAAHFRGIFKATFTWHGDAAHPNSPAPAQVTVIKRSVASWSALYSNYSGDCDTGLGQSHGSGATTSNSDSVTGYAAEIKGGASFSVSCTPTADVYGTAGAYYSIGQAHATFTAAAVFMNLAGTTLNKQGNTDAILIGQRCTANLTGLPTAFATGGALKGNISFAWGVPAKSTFQSWNGTSGTTPVNAVLGPGPLNLSTAQWYWLDKASMWCPPFYVPVTK